MELGDRIAVLENGRIAQLADPHTLYSEPASRYVATFVGSTNEVEGKVVAVSATGVELDTVLGRVVAGRAAEDVQIGDAAVAIFRPEKGAVSTTRPDGPNVWEVVYRQELFSGTHGEHVLTRDHHAYRVWNVSTPVPDPDAPAWMSVDPSNVHVFRP